MKKLLLLFAVLLTSVGAWAQEDCLYQKIPHTQWGVSAFNEQGVSGNEGGVAFLKDENASTFYHSKYNERYEGSTSGKDKGNDGVQGFLITLPETYSFDRITYKGRSDKSVNWATKVRIYVYETLPTDLPENLSSLTYIQKETLFNLTNGTLSANPAFENSTLPWANDQNIKTIDFSTPQSGKYVLFIADECTGENGYFTCSDIHLWQKVEGVEQDIPYFLKIDRLDDNYLDTRVGVDDSDGNENKTISKTTEKIATYFTLTDGYWHISSLPGNEFKFVQVIDWDAVPGCSQPSNWTLHKDGNGKWYLAQSTYYASTSNTNHYLGANGGNISDNSLVFTDKAENEAVKFELIELTDEELAVEEVRAAEGRVNAAKEIAQQVLGKIGVGYPAPGSEARATLQAAIDNVEATVESIYSAIDAYNAVTDVVLPEAGKVYRLTSAYSAFTSEKALYSDNTQLKWGDKNTSAMNQLWVVQNISGNNLTLMNVGDAMYPQVSGFQAQVRMLHVKNESSLTAFGAGKFRVMANKLQSMFPDNHGNGAGSGGTISNSNYEPSQWYFEEVAITKEILTAQVNSIKTAYVGSLLLKEEGVSNLQNATEVAEAVCNTDNGDYTTAFAQLIEAVNNATIEYIDLGYFYIKSKGAQKYAYNNNNVLNVAESKSPKSIFKMTKANNGTYYIQNGNGYYVQNTGNGNNTAVPISTNKVEYTISRLASGHYVLRQTSSTGSHAFWHDANNSTGNLVGWESVADNSQWTFEPLTEEELAKIYTVNFATYDASHYLSYTGEYAGDKDVKANGGFYVLDAVPTETDLNVQNLGDYASSVNIDAIQRNIKVVTGVDNSSIYILRCLKDNTYARYHSGCQLSANDKTNMMTWQGGMVMESLFYIEEGTGKYAGFYTIRSYAAPTMYAYNLGTANEDSKVAMKEAPAEGGLTGEYYWKITYRNENGTPANITPYHEGGDTGDKFGWNKRGGYNGKNHIGYWNKSDEDSNATNDNKWYVRTVEEELTALGKLPLPQYTSDNSVIGLTTYESVEPLIGFEELINQTGLNAINNVSYKVVGPKVGSFIRLKNEKSSKYMYGNKTTIKITDDAKANELPSTIFYLDKSNTLLSYVDGRYLDCEEKGYSAVGTANAGEFNFAYGGAKENVVVYKNHGVYTFGGATSGVGPDNIDKGSGYNENGYNWIVEEVTSLPFTFNPAGLGFATFNAPVAVELPEGVLAYVTQINLDNNTLQMYRLEDKVVPANTPVMLYCEAAKTEGATKELTIVSTYTGNEFNGFEYNKSFYGTIAAEEYSTDCDYTIYSLRKSAGKNTVGFYQKASGNLGGFKAWIKLDEEPDAQGARTFTIIFDGDDATGLKEALGLENENVEIYDLSGRRLDKPAKGVNVIGGKLVIK